MSYSREATLRMLRDSTWSATEAAEKVKAEFGRNSARTAWERGLAKGFQLALSIVESEEG
jgi:hypothetical protein